MGAPSALLPAGKLIAPAVSPSFLLPWLLRRHQFSALAALGFGLLTLWYMYRPRRAHGGIGRRALFFGILWAAAVASAGIYGGRMSWPPLPMEPAASAPDKVEPPDPEAELPVRFLDYASLIPIQPGFVRGHAHGERWERVWITASGLDAYRQNRPLPPGAYAVVGTAEDRWGRPGPDPGPLYAYEILASGRPSFTVYWGRVPEEKRGEFQGAASIYWRRQSPELERCLSCHAGGASDPAQRLSFVSRRPAAPALPGAATPTP